LGILNPTDCVVPDLADWLNERDLLAKTLIDLKEGYRKGDLVYQKLQPHVQSSIVSRINH
jgi:hypothetical protein